MQHVENSFIGANGVSLFVQSWRPETAPKAILVIVHGFGEHSGRYTNLVSGLVPQGYALYSFDLRGHGRSPGQRGHVDTWADYRTDVGAYLDGLSSYTQNGIPIFLYGHSLGGLIALDYALHRPQGLHAVIASAPSLGKIGISAPLLALSKVVSKVWPTFSMSSGLNAAGLSRDPAMVQAYRSDPLVHGMGSARLGSEIGVTQDWVQAHAADLRLPLLMIQGSADAITAPADSLRFYNNAGSPDKQLLLVEGAYHEVHNDVGHQQTIQNLADWINGHLNA
ncbi:MAG: lysophospholipase [Chloroflexi bacterium]|nr:lysophospholipase [Chloroflexota bacterium]